MRLTAETKGLKKLLAKWNKAPKKIKKLTQDALLKAGYIVEGASKRLTPVDTGRMRASISVASSLALRAEPHVVISPHTKYAKFVHDGTRFMTARPFMTRGYENSRAKIKRQMNELQKDILNEL